MKEYLFYTAEGATYSPNITTDIENCQLLGYSKGKDKSTALQNLLIENPWIEESQFDISKFMGVQIFSQDAKQALRKLVDYLWKEEKKHFEESGKPKDHIFNIIKLLNNLLV